MDPRSTRGQQADGRPAAGPQAADAHAKPRLLLVDDDENIHFLLRYMLGPVYQLDMVFDTESALELVRMNRYHLALLDINLGGGASGFDLLAAIRRIEGNEQTPAIAVTAYALPGDRERLLAHGFDEYLSKPFTRAQVLELVAKTRRRR